MLNARAPGLELAVDIHEAVDPGFQAGPAKPGPGIQLQRKQLRGVLDVEPGGVRSDHGNEDVVIAGDFRKAKTLIQQALQDFGQRLVARCLHQLPLRVERADRLDARLPSQHLRRQRSDHEHDVARLLVATGVERLLDQRGVADLDEIFRAEREVALPAAQIARRRRRDRHQAVELFAKRIFVPGDGVEERRIILQHGAAELVLRRALLAPDPFEHATNGVLIKPLDRIFGGVADADHVDHGLHFGQRLTGRGYRAVDGAEALPEPEDMTEVVETAFAGAIEEAAEIFKRIDDVPFGEGEKGIVQFAAITWLVDRG